MSRLCLTTTQRDIIEAQLRIWGADESSARSIVSSAVDGMPCELFFIAVSEALKSRML
jgi:hypothetical protein